MWRSAENTDAKSYETHVCAQQFWCVSEMFFLGHYSLCVMPDALAERFSHVFVLFFHLCPRFACLDSSWSDFAPPVSVFVFFCSHLCLSHSYTLYALTFIYIVSLGTTAINDTLTFIPVLLKNATQFFRIKETSPPVFTSCDGTPEIPHERRWRLCFLKQIAGTFGLSSSWWWMVVDFFPPIFSINLEWWKVFIIFFFWGGLGVGAWLDFKSNKSHKSHLLSDFSRAFFTTDPFGSRNHHQTKKSIQGNHLESQSQPCINGCFNQLDDEPNLYIGNVWKSPNFHPSIGKKLSLDFSNSRQGLKVRLYRDQLRQGPPNLMSWLGPRRLLGISRWVVQVKSDWLSRENRRSPDFQLLGITYFIEKYTKLKLLFHGPKWLSRKQIEINHFPGK